MLSIQEKINILSPKDKTWILEEVGVALNDPGYCKFYGVNYLNITEIDLIKVMETIYNIKFKN